MKRDAAGRRNQWAIITGASSGIGKALALEFAQGGYNLMLTGRNTKKLNEVAQQCAESYRVEVDTVSADLASPPEVDGLLAAISANDRHYEILVNNAGFGIHGSFAATEIKGNVELINVQLTAALRLTKAVLPAMIARRSGRILNVASVYAYSPVPFQSVYSACKAFLLSFSTSLLSEVKDSGVTVTVFCPGITQTEFRSRAGIAERRADSGMTAAEAAKIAYRAALRGTHIVVPGILNRVFVFLVQLLPRTSVPSLIRFINRQRGQSHS